MPRFQLLVRELGREPRAVPLSDDITVGRSRSVDLTVDDEEVGRKQFRIGVQSGFVVLEGLGATNPTRIGDSIVKAGERTTVDSGTIIRVGKTEFVVEAVGEPAPPSGGSQLDRTMVAPKPGEAPDRTMATPGPGGPGMAKPPTNTMQFPRPGAGPLPGAGGRLPGAGGPVDAERTMPPVGPGPRPGGTPPGPGAGTDRAGQDDFGRTMPLPPGGGPRPPGPGPTPQQTPPQQPPQKPQQPPKERPRAQTEVHPPPSPPRPPAKKKPEPAPPPPRRAEPEVPASQEHAAEPRPRAPEPAREPQRAESKDRPSTVAVDVVPHSKPLIGDDTESRLHQSQPLLFVKGDGLKQRLRLMKAVTRIGRAESADLLLPRESVSEQHAEIRFDGKVWTLHDSGGTNGTVCDGNHLRGTSQRIQRNSLIGVGTLQLIFLHHDPKNAARDKRMETRALDLLARIGRLERWEAGEIKGRARRESQSIAEIVLRETSLAPADWATAVATVRDTPTLVDRLLGALKGLFGRKRSAPR